MIPPCKDCPDRQIGCHSTCEKYIEFKKENDKLRKERFIQNQITQYAIEANDRRYNRIRKCKYKKEVT